MIGNFLLKKWWKVLKQNGGKKFDKMAGIVDEKRRKIV